MACKRHSTEASKMKEIQFSAFNKLSIHTWACGNKGRAPLTWSPIDASHMAQQQLHLAQSQIPPANLPTAAILKTMHLAAASHTTHQIRDWKQKGKNTKKGWQNLHKDSKVHKNSSSKTIWFLQGIYYPGLEPAFILWGLRNRPVM